MTGAVRNRTLFVSAEAALSFVGAGIAGTIWRADQIHQDLPCTADGGCEIVSASRWSHVDLIVLHHVPVAILGLAGMFCCCPLRCCGLVRTTHASTAACTR